VAYKLFLATYENPLPVYSSTGLDIIENIGQPLSHKIHGRYFTFLKFIDFLVICAKTTYSDNKSES